MTTLVLPADGDTGWGAKARTAWTTTIGVADAAATAAAAAQSTANAAYVKPGTGIPATDLATVVQTSLGLANSALQSAPVTSVATRTGAVTLANADVSGSAPLASPALTGTPTAPTATVGTNTTQLATTAFVIANAGSGGAVTSVAGRTGAVVIAESDVTNLTTDLAAKAPLASPALTGTPTAPTASAATSTTQLATTAFATTADNLKANLASPTFTGTPLAPTATAGTNTTQLATTAFVLANSAPLASPAFTGTPTAPTAAPGTNTTQVATTAFDAASNLLTLAAAQQVAVTAITAAYTLLLTDQAKAVEYTSASGAAVTIPPNSSVAFPIGTVIEIAQLGAGQPTITAGSGVTLHSAGSLVKTRVQYSTCSIRKQATDTWLLAGDLA